MAVSYSLIVEKGCVHKEKVVADNMVKSAMKFLISIFYFFRLSQTIILTPQPCLPTCRDRLSPEGEGEETWYHDFVSIIH